MPELSARLRAELGYWIELPRQAYMRGYVERAFAGIQKQLKMELSDSPYVETVDEITERARRFIDSEFERNGHGRGQQ
jgi:hypothetical protein